MPIYFKLKYAYRLPDLQPFEVTTLQCRIMNPSTLGLTVDQVLKMLCPRQSLPHWESHLPLDRHANFSSITGLKVGITSTNKS